MQLSEIRQAFVEISGYAGLVTDAEGGDFTDKAGLVVNGTYLINAGMRWLHRRWPGKGSEFRYNTRLRTGEYKVTIPHIQFIRRLDITDGVTISHPRLISYDEMRSRYTDPWGSVTAARPTFWTWLPRGDASLENPIINGSFANGLTGWTITEATTGQSMPSTLPTVSEGQLLLIDSGLHDPIIYQRLNQTFPDTTEVTIDIASISSGSVVAVIFFSWQGSLPGSTFRYYRAFHTAGSHTFNARTGGFGPGGDWDTIAILFEADGIGTGTATVNSIAMEVESSEPVIATYSRQLLFMAPADDDYTVEIWGAFTSPALTTESSSNWWTEEHPDLVIAAARGIYERDNHRNVSGARVFEEYCENELHRLWAEYQFSLYSGMNPEDLAING